MRPLAAAARRDRYADPPARGRHLEAKGGPGGWAGLGVGQPRRLATAQTWDAYSFAGTGGTGDRRMMPLAPCLL